MTKVSPFGVCTGGSVSAITLSDGQGMTVELLSLGATLRSIILPDRQGHPTDICLGYDTAQAYWEDDVYLGACLGRCANRIAGAGFTLNGQHWPLSANTAPHHLHGGHKGFDKKIWSFSTTDDSVTFSTDSPHLEEGYPGKLQVQVTYSIVEIGCLEIRYRAVCDQDTVVNLTNHSYFNLAGQGSGPVVNHVLHLRAGRYTPGGLGNIPTGEILPVDGTVFDLRQGVRLGDVLPADSLSPTRGFDHNLVLDDPADGPFFRAHCPQNGLVLEADTTLEGVQLYTAGFLTPRCGKGGAVYGPAHGFCIETQHFPNAINQPNFPSPVLRAGAEYHQRTRFRFFVQR